MRAPRGALIYIPGVCENHECQKIRYGALAGPSRAFPGCFIPDSPRGSQVGPMREFLSGPQLGYLGFARQFPSILTWAPSGPRLGYLGCVHEFPNMFPSISSRAPSGPHPGNLGLAYQLLRFARKLKHRPHLGKLGCAHKFPRYTYMGPVWAPSGLSGPCPLIPTWAPSGPLLGYLGFAR